MPDLERAIAAQAAFEGLRYALAGSYQFRPEVLVVGASVYAVDMLGSLLDPLLGVPTAASKSRRDAVVAGLAGVAAASLVANGVGVGAITGLPSLLTESPMQAGAAALQGAGALMIGDYVVKNFM